MSLKFNTQPTYELKLPSNGKTVKYRPFIVAEEKILLMAMEEGDETGMLEAIKNTIDACTFGVVNIEELPTVDVEYLFIALRNKSLGEGIDLDAYCYACNAKNSLSCNLADVQIVQGSVDKVIELGPELKVSMRYPTIKDSINATDDKSADAAIKSVAKCIEFIEYKGKLHEVDSLPIEEVIEFVEGLTQAQLRALNKFIDAIPHTLFEQEFKCSKCGEVNKIKLEGISNFFA